MVVDKRNARVNQRFKLRKGRRLDEKENIIGLTRRRITNCNELNTEESAQFEPEVACFGTETLLLSTADHLGVMVDYNFKFANENNRGGGEHRGRRLAEKADHLTLFDQGVRLRKAFIKIRNYDMREAAINFMVFLAEVGE